MPTDDRTDAPGGQPLEAPGLREVAQVWWDLDEDPVVRWRDGGAVFVLTDPRGEHELVLARFADAPDDAATMASILAEGLAACDFPPTGEGASPARVAATLRAAGRPERPDRP